MRIVWCLHDSFPVMYDLAWIDELEMQRVYAFQEFEVIGYCGFNFILN